MKECIVVFFLFFLWESDGRLGRKKKVSQGHATRQKKNHPLTWAQGVARRKTPELGKRGGATKNPRAGRKGVAWRKTPALFLGGGGAAAAAQGQGQRMCSDLGRPRRPLARQARARKHTHRPRKKKHRWSKKNKEKKALRLRIVQRDPKETKAFTSLGLRGEKTK